MPVSKGTYTVFAQTTLKIFFLRLWFLAVYAGILVRQNQLHNYPWTMFWRAGLLRNPTLGPFTALLRRVAASKVLLVTNSHNDAAATGC